MVTIDLFRNEPNTRSYSAGQKIFGEGDAGDTMFIVMDGEVDLLVREILVEKLVQGCVLGEMALIDSVPRSATAVARTDCRLVQINEKRFQFLVQQTPKFALQLMRVIVERLRRMNEKL